MRKLISFVCAIGLIVAGAIFTIIKHGYEPRAGLMGVFMFGVGVAWLWADFIGPLFGKGG